MPERKSRPSRKGSDREDYLGQLTQEYIATSSLEAKQQVLANLANFAYNPQNYAALWQVNAVDLFIASLTEHDAYLKEFGAGGLANISQDPTHRGYILSEDRCTELLRDLIVQYSTGDHHHMTADGIINTIVALMHLIEPQSGHAIISQPLEDALIRLTSQSTPAPTATGGRQQIRTMASLFLQDYFRQ